MEPSSQLPALDIKSLASYCFETLLHRLTPPSDGVVKPGYPAGMPDPEYPLFVTWTKHGDLRGCIGTFESKRLSHALPKYTLISALQDDRFEPMQLGEVPDLTLGLSLLVNFTPIDDPLKWEVGKHGIEIEFSHGAREYSGTFLPEVAEEEGWDQRTTLEYLVRKAGWRNGFEAVRATMRVRTYESLKCKLTF